MKSGTNSPAIKKDSTPQYLMYDPAQMAKMFQSSQKALQKSQVAQASEFTDPKNQNRMAMSDLFGNDNLQQSFDASFYQDLSQLQLQDQYAQLLIDHEIQNKQINQFQQKVNGLQEELQKKNKLIETMESGDQNLQIEEIQKFKEQIEAQTKTIQSLELSINDKEVNYQKTNGENLQKIQGLQEEIQKKSDLIKQWFENTDEKNIKLEFISLIQLKNKLTQQLKQEKAANDKLHTEQNQKINKLQNNLNVKELQNQNQEKELSLLEDSLQEQIKTLKDGNMTKQKEIEELLQKQNQLNDEYHDKQLELNNAKNELLIQISSLQQQIDNHKQNEKKFQVTIENLNSENIKQKNEITKIQEEMKNAINNKQEMVELKTEELQQSKTLVQIKDKKIEQVQKELEEKNEQLVEVRQNLKKEEEATKQYLDNITMLKTEIAEKSQKISELNNNCESLQQTIAEQQSQNLKIKEYNNSQMEWLRDLNSEKEKKINQQIEEIKEKQQYIEELNIIEQKEQNNQQIKSNELSTGDNELESIKQLLSEKEAKLLQNIKQNQGNQRIINNLKDQQAEEIKKYEAHIQQLINLNQQVQAESNQKNLVSQKLLENEKKEQIQLKQELQQKANQLEKSQQKIEELEKQLQKNILENNQLTKYKQELREQQKLVEESKFKLEEMSRVKDQEFLKEQQQVNKLKDELNSKALVINLEQTHNQKLFQSLSELEIANQELKIQQATEKARASLEKQTLNIQYSEQLKQKTEELNSQKQLYAKEIEDLKNDINKLEEKNKQQSIFFKEQKKQFYEKQEILEEEIINLKGQLVELYKLKIDSLEPKIISDQLNQSQLQKQNLQLQEQLQTFKQAEKQSFLEQEKKKTDIIEKLKQNQQELQKQQKNYKELEQQFSKLFQEKETSFQQAAKIETQFHEEQRINEKLQKNLELIENTLSQLEAKNAQQEVEIEKLKEEITKQIQANFDLKCYKLKKFESIDDSIDIIKKKISEASAYLVKLRKYSVVQEKDLAELAKILKSCLDGVSECTPCFSSAQDKFIQSLEGNLKNYRSKIEQQRLQQNIENEKECLKDLEAMLQKVKQ